MGDVYVGINGVPKKVKALWVGVNDVPKKVKNAWVGVNGIPKIVYTEIGKPVVLHVTNDGTVTWSAVAGAAYYKVKKLQNGTWITSSTKKTTTSYKLVSFTTSVTGVAVIAYKTNTVFNTSDTYDTDWIRITFNGNGGEASESYNDILSGNTLDSLPYATKDNYVFDGWYTRSSGGTKITLSTVFSSNTIVYAHWTESILYWTVTFDANGGSCAVSSRDVVRGSAIGTLPSANRDGYDFDGWYVNGSIINSRFIPTSDCDAVAHWSLILQESRITSVDHEGYVYFESATGASYYRVRKYQNGSWATSVKTYNTYLKLQSIGTSVTKLAVISYDDYGNYLTSDEYNISWVKITFNGNGGTPSTSYYNRITSNDYYYPMTEEIGELPTATRSGYIFDGWWTGTSSYSSRIYPTAKYSSDITVYAHWKNLTPPTINSASRSSKTVTWTRPSWATKVALFKSGNSGSTSQDRSIIYSSNGHKLSSGETVDNYTSALLTGTSFTFKGSSYMYEVCVVAWDDDGNHTATWMNTTA